MGDAAGYVQVNQHVRPYSRQLVALPRDQSDLAKTAAGLSSEAGKYFREFGTRILLDEDEWDAVMQSDAMVTPYMDPVLKHNPREYAKFVADLLRARVCCLRTRRKAEATPFFVSKKDGRLGMVLDCRVSNLRMRRPPSCPLAQCLRLWI